MPGASLRLVDTFLHYVTILLGMSFRTNSTVHIVHSYLRFPLFSSAIGTALAPLSFARGGKSAHIILGTYRQSNQWRYVRSEPLSNQSRTQGRYVRS